MGQGMADWISTKEAMARLNIRPQTLYAYVSRGKIEARSLTDDPRQSLYRAADIAKLQIRKARGRKAATVAEDTIALGEPVLASSMRPCYARPKCWRRWPPSYGQVITHRCQRLI